METIDTDRGLKILQSLAVLADFVVLDLAPAASAVNRALLSKSDYLAFVVGREPVCVQAAKRMLLAVQDVAPPVCGLVVVNRDALASPYAHAEIERELGTPIFEVIPPAPDLCVQSQRNHVPLVQLDRESLAAESFLALARSFQKKWTPPVAAPARPVRQPAVRV